MDAIQGRRSVATLLARWRRKASNQRYVVVRQTRPHAVLIRIGASRLASLGVKRRAALDATGLWRLERNGRSGPAVGHRV